MANNNIKYAGSDAKWSGDAKYSNGDEWYELDGDVLDGVAGGIHIHGGDAGTDNNADNEKNRNVRGPLGSKSPM